MINPSASKSNCNPIDVCVYPRHINTESYSNVPRNEMSTMKFKKPAEDLVVFLDERLDRVDCNKRKMFGQYAYFLNGNMFTGVFQSDIFLRLPPDFKRELMENDSKIQEFEPRNGRVMKEYILVPSEILSQEDAFSTLLSSSLEYVSHLPPKKKS
ncbi:TfoX family protein [Candidatus Thorarchaeota archaeon]|nr:MAG: TfoX family protein [Candidatus Thorarchaeota archaeon]